jgi:hypothetical protein
MRIVMLFSATAAIFVLMAAGGDYAPARPETGPRGDFDPAGWISAPTLSLAAPGRDAVHAA